MAQKTREELNAANAALFVNNETGDITPDEERAYNEDVNDSFSIRYEFDVTITDTAAIQALNSAPIELVADDGTNIQLISATIQVNDDGTTNYDFGGFMSINSGTSSIVAVTADWTGTNVGLGSLTPTTIDANAPSIYNLTKVSRSDDNTGGLFLTSFDDATAGDRTIRVYGTYIKFPIA
jgi:hypothetical protein